MRLVPAMVLSGLLLDTSPALGELTVIYQGPDSHPITDFLSPTRRDTTRQQPSPTPPVNASGVWDIQRLLPIRSSGLTPGPVEPRKLALPVAQALFLIGADNLSKAWLARHRSRLHAFGAVGMLVQAEDRADLEAIAELAGDLPIVPASGADVATALGLAHYPVCITGQGIWQ